jgi:hypothetical protein
VDLRINVARLTLGKNRRTRHDLIVVICRAPEVLIQWKLRKLQCGAYLLSKR